MHIPVPHWNSYMLRVKIVASKCGGRGVNGLSISVPDQHVRVGAAIPMGCRSAVGGTPIEAALEGSREGLAEGY